MTANKGLFSSLRHRDFRYLMGAFSLGDAGSWMYNVALVVWVYDATGSVGWLAATTVCRFAPALVFSAYAGVVADRFEKVRLLNVVDCIFAVVMCAMAVMMTVDAPVVGVMVLAAVASSLGTFYDPAASALTPLLVPERDLASANALRNTIDNITVVVGPAIGGLLLLVGPPQLAVWVNAATFVCSALVISRLKTRSTPVDVTEGGSAGPWKQMQVGIRTIAASPAVTVLVGYSLLATFAFGIDTVLFVSVSDEILGTGPDGYGYLLAGLGVGGVLAAPLVTRAESLPSLAPIILGGMAVYCLPTLVLLVTTSPSVAFGAQVLRGAGTLFVDVLAMTALQRTLDNDVLARVYGAFNAMLLIVILIGSAVTPFVIEGAGLDAAIWAAGAGLFALSLLGLPWLRAMDRTARERRAALAPRIALIEACDLFADVPDGGLVQLAGDAEEKRYAAGDVVIAQGEVADAFYVLVEGSVGVTSAVAGGPAVDLPDLGPGDYFGEIGLIERIERTATVTARTDITVLRIDGATFLDALTTNTPSAAILDGAAIRLGRTNPTEVLRRRGLDPDEGAAAS